MFLLAQREKDRKGCVGGIDKKRETQRNVRENVKMFLIIWKKKSKQEQEKLTTVKLFFSDRNSDNDT